MSVASCFDLAPVYLIACVYVVASVYKGNNPTACTRVKLLFAWFKSIVALDTSNTMEGWLRFTKYHTFYIYLHAVNAQGNGRNDRLTTNVFTNNP